MDQDKKPVLRKSTSSIRTDTKTKDVTVKAKAQPLLVSDDSKPIISDIKLRGSAPRVVLRPPGSKF